MHVTNLIGPPQSFFSLNNFFPLIN